MHRFERDSAVKRTRAENNERLAAAEIPRKKQTIAENALPVLKLLYVRISRTGHLQNCNTTDPAIHVVIVGVRAFVRFQAFTGIHAWAFDEKIVNVWVFNARPVSTVYTSRKLIF